MMKHPFGRKPSVILGALLTVLLSCGPAPAFEASIRSGTLSIDADGVPLTRVLRRLGEGGVRIRIAPDLDRPVSARFQERPLTSGLASILRPLNHSLVWESIETPLGPVHRLAEIVVFRPGQPQEALPLSTPRTLSLRIDPLTGARYVAREILLGFDERMEPAAFRRLLAEIGGTLRDIDPTLGIYHVLVPAEVDVPALVDRLQRTPGVAAAEPNWAYPLDPTLPATPHGALSLPALPSEAAVRSGDPPPVAVFDSGWQAPAGYEDAVVNVYDAVAPESAMADADGHGTQMALIAAGRMQPTGVGAAATAAAVPVVAVRAFDDNGFTSSRVLLRGIDYALSAGARVMSLSWGSETRSEFVERALHRARRQGALVVASAGNENTGRPIYPAAYDAVVGVDSLAPNGEPWPRSNTGHFVTVMAPGFASLPVGRQGEAAGTYAGTSIAAAYTARRLAEALGRNPEAKADEILVELAR